MSLGSIPPQRTEIILATGQNQLQFQEQVKPYPASFCELEAKLLTNDKAKFTQQVSKLFAQDLPPLERMSAYLQLKRLMPKEDASKLNLSTNYFAEQNIWSFSITYDDEAIFIQNEIPAKSTGDLACFHEFCRLNSRQWFVDNCAGQPQAEIEELFKEVTQPQRNPAHSYVLAAKRLIELLPEELQSQFKIVKHEKEGDWYFEVQRYQPLKSADGSPLLPNVCIMAYSPKFKGDEHDDLQRLNRIEQIEYLLCRCKPDDRPEVQYLLAKLEREQSLVEHLQTFQDIQKLCIEQHDTKLTAEIVEIESANIKFLTLSFNGTHLFCSKPIAILVDDSVVVGTTKANIEDIYPLVNTINQETVQSQVNTEIEHILLTLTDIEFNDDAPESITTLLNNVEELIPRSHVQEKHQQQLTQIKAELDKKQAGYNLWMELKKSCDEGCSDAAYQTFKTIFNIQSQIPMEMSETELTNALLPHLRELRKSIKSEAKPLLTVSQKMHSNNSIQLQVCFNEQILLASDSYPKTSKQAKTINQVTSYLELEFTATISFENFRTKIDSWRRPGTEGFHDAYITLLNALGNDELYEFPINPQTKLDAFYLLRNFLIPEVVPLFNVSFESIYENGSYYLHLRVGNAELNKEIKEIGSTSIENIKSFLGYPEKPRLPNVVHTTKGLIEAHKRARRIWLKIPNYSISTASETKSPRQPTFHCSYLKTDTDVTKGVALELPLPTPEPLTAEELAKEMVSNVTKYSNVSGMLEYLKSNDFQSKKHVLPANCWNDSTLVPIWGAELISYDVKAGGNGAKMSLKDALESYGHQYL
ncbi:hypothetical protein D5018_10075 [Parashewanella curva]|uniref:Uncharacterized protein n=1 Tax=Parashewanella curva TaxID=2338552 RepID=A0A3L8PYZ2_9GAMM|nr:hypothetical protein [Parashewanella curva]RLV59813.1 hypothetical protein D5018_10075 [Parashewanella curva]